MKFSSFFATAPLLFVASSCNGQTFTAAPVTSVPDVSTFTGAPLTGPPLTSPPVTSVPFFQPVVPSPTDTGEAFYNELKISIPRFRFVLWEDYDQKELAEELGYTAENWGAAYRQNKLEKVSFRGLGENQTNVIAMGFTEDSWNCWMNHYTDSPWPRLERSGVQKDWLALGYTQLHWNETITKIPAEANHYWEGLSAAAKQAAANLCYLPQTWNQNTPFSDGWLTTSAYLKSTEPWIGEEVIPSNPTVSPSDKPVAAPTEKTNAPTEKTKKSDSTSDSYSVSSNGIIIGLLMVVSNFLIMK